MDIVAQQSVAYGGDDTFDLQHGRESLAVVDGPATVMVLGGHAVHARVDSGEVDRVAVAKPDATVNVPLGAQVVFSPVVGGIRLSIARDTKTPAKPETKPRPKTKSASAKKKS